MKKGMEIEPFVNEVRRQATTRVDFFAVPELLQFGTVGAGDKTEGLLEVTHGIGNGRKQQDYRMNRYALSQLAEHLHIPLKYLELMRVSQPDLLTENVNCWLRSLHGQPEQKRLIRVLDNRVRAFLSPKYRIIDNKMLVEFILPELATMGLDVDFHSLDLSERSLYIKAVSNKRQAEVQVGDVVQSGVVITNSEVGYRRLSVSPLLLRLVCSNGLIMPEHGLKRSHIGRMIVEDDLVSHVLSEETIRTDNLALMLKVRDAVRHAMSETVLNEMADKMRATLGIQITGDPVQAVEMLSHQYDLTRPEHTGVMEALIRGQDISAFGLINAVTAYAQTVEDYDRSTELEEIGGKLLTLNQKAWRPIVEARATVKESAKLAVTA